MTSTNEPYTFFRAVTRGCGWPMPVPPAAIPTVIFDSVGKDTILRSLDCLRSRGLMVTFGQAPGPIDRIAPVLLSQKGSLFLTHPFLFQYIQRRDALVASANAHD